MKKAIIIILTLGLVLVGFAFYFAESSILLHSQFDRKIEYNKYRVNETSKLEDRIKHIQQLDENQYNYEYLELNQVDFVKVNDCVQKHLSENEITDKCKDVIIDIIVDDYGEVDFIESIIGHSINYYSFSIGYPFPRNLFGEKAPLNSKLILHFLNRYREPQKLQQEFDAYKNHFYKRIPKSIYDKIFDEYITKLISTYQDIESKEDKEAYFKEIYFKAESQNLHSKYWKVTFWKRRALEKNNIVIYNILTEIKRHYQE